MCVGYGLFEGANTGVGMTVAIGGSTVDSQAARITPTCGTPLWDGCGAQEQGEGVEAMLDWDMTNQSASDYPEDRRIDW